MGEASLHLHPSQVKLPPQPCYTMARLAIDHPLLSQNRPCPALHFVFLTSDLRLCMSLGFCVRGKRIRPLKIHAVVELVGRFWGHSEVATTPSILSANANC